MKKLTVLLMVVLGLHSIILSGQKAAPAPEAALSSDRLARIDRVLQQYVDENRLAGARRARATRRHSGL
jgi:hypothetical protein